MNNKFYNLSKEKQNQIVNSGYKAFSQQSYRKTSMQYIADEGDVSKSLLFHYFRNKKELYFYLYNLAVEDLKKIQAQYRTSSNDFFNIIEREIETRIALISVYPYIYQFVINVYFEDCEEVVSEIADKKASLILTNKQELLSAIDTSKFRNPDDVNTLYDIIVNMFEGYLAKKLRIHPLDFAEIEKDVKQLINNLRANYYK
ncbi:MAG: TetR/AcrR family transcriptional regulator [Clostridia bacterium]|nr:TetR/AcrR family transcriptional regulator [Clostridia bacterium]